MGASDVLDEGDAGRRVGDVAGERGVGVFDGAAGHVDVVGDGFAGDGVLDDARHGGKGKRIKGEAVVSSISLERGWSLKY